MLENEFKQVLDKRKEQLESKTVFDSPDWFQWHAYTTEFPFRYMDLAPDRGMINKQEKQLYNKREKLLDKRYLIAIISFWLLIANTIVWAMLWANGVSIGILLVFTIVFALTTILSLTKPIGKLFTNIVDNSLGYKDNHNYKFYDSKTKLYERYYDLHKLYYVKGEYYRKWYIEYVLGLDTKEFVREDEFSRLIMDTVRGNYIDGKHLYNSEYHTVVEVIESGMSEREHWVNSLATTRFLTYKEFMTIEETSSLVKSVKEKDKYITQFESYMRNKDKLQKERYNE